MKYKEFWIADYVIGRAVSDDAKIRSSFDKPGDLREIHVIEYQALLDEAEAHKTTAAALQSKIEKLQKQNEKLKNALSYYCAHQLYKPIIGMRLDEKTSKLIYEMGSIARKTLEELDNDPAS